MIENGRGYFELETGDKLILGIEHDYPFAPSQLPYLKTLARAAVGRAAVMDELRVVVPTYSERVEAIINMEAPSTLSNEEIAGFVG